VVAEAELLAADAVGDVIGHWGFRKALGRVWTVLYLAGEPLGAADLCERLQMSAGAMSMTLNELQRWGVVRTVWRPGERREFFEAETDFWKMISRVVHDREREIVRSVRQRLDEAADLLRDAPPSPQARERMTRVRRLLSFATMAETVVDSFIASRRADFSEFGNVLQIVRATTRGRRG
jgi:DNA-binding transcriptional regulator GbsR (MarR family)